ncbi:PEP-CTERM sorting domain-containing protein [Colwellia demingiae]|uniref:PEP-CTERM sorting domain-containing protein n=1 Tax=Colwellia demingiae TaxID=89401 RepID=A0A5C6QPL5_9GAMM|nr:PEP-CTERM sorting domain-containing protein [Colwellia demingiae]TWX70673.1 PEP-CTERM sorting domain-containing protein [Colwellia demingiae]
MIKLFSKISFTLCFLFMGVSQATILPLNSNALTSDDYIVHNYDGVDYDVVWASKVNTERWYTDRDYNFNTLFAPSYYENSGWAYAGQDGIPDLLTIFSGLEGSEIESLFKSNNTYVHAFSHWNSVFDEVTNNNDILNKDMKSTWSWFAPDVDINSMNLDDKKSQRTDISSTSGTTYDTFYVRKSNVSVPVPEPSTLIIFVFGIIALASKKRLFN